MARGSGLFSDDLLVVVKKSFVAGCFGCLGAGTMAVLIFLTVSVIFPTQFVALVKTLPIPLFPQVVPVVTPTTPVTQLPAIEIWVSTDNQCTGARVTQLKLPVQQALFVCARNPQGVSVHFMVQITLPDGRTVPIAADLVTNPSGKPFSIGAWSEPPVTPGVYRIDALVGSTIVGSTVVTVIS